VLLNILAILAILINTCDHFTSLPPGFLSLDSCFHILGALMGSTSFVGLFLVEVLREDLWTISNFLMLVNLHATFVMFSLCYAQHPSYLLHTMFPSLNIL
jgi:hypothetical protein